MTANWLSKHLPEAAFSTCSIVQDEPVPASVDEFDGYIITGSKHGVYEDLPWMQALRAFLLKIREVQKPVFGICFGHQIMAAAFEGEVCKSAKGWGIGAQEYDYAQESGLKSSASFLFHQDQVEAVPKGAKVIGGNTFCPIGALAYDFPALSVQFHPEFSKEYVAELARLYGGDRIPQGIADTALQTLECDDVDNDHIAVHVAAFFRQSILSMSVQN